MPISETERCPDEKAEPKGEIVVPSRVRPRREKTTHSAARNVGGLAAYLIREPLVYRKAGSYSIESPMPY